jgi:hypothetical protein
MNRGRHTIIYGLVHYVQMGQLVGASQRLMGQLVRYIARTVGWCFQVATN